MPRVPLGISNHTTSQLKPTQICTRANHGIDHTPTCDELVKVNQDSFLLAEQAQEYLEKQGYAPPNAQGGKAALSYTL